MKPTALIATLHERSRDHRARFSAVQAIEREWYALENRTDAAAADVLTRWLRASVERIGSPPVVVGVSGGVDSTLATLLMQRALPGRGTGLILPCRSDPADEADARALLELLGVPCRVIDLTPMLDLSLAALGDTSTDERDLAVGNLGCRLRQSLLYFIANREGALVLGTGDFDEAWIGYGCKGTSSDVSPICGLHKDEIRALVRLLLCPLDAELGERLASRPASPGYYPGQNAEDELGMSYGTVASALEVLVPHSHVSMAGGLRPRDSMGMRIALAKERVAPEDVLAVADRMTENLHKTMDSPALWRHDVGSEEP